MHPYVPCCLRVLHTKTHSRFCSIARGCHRVQTLLSPPQKGRRKLRGILRKEKQKVKPFYTAPRDSTEAMFRLRRNGEFVLPPWRRYFASETAKHRGFCEAASLTTLGPHGQKAHKPRGYIGGYFPLCTFSSGFAQRNITSLSCDKEVNNKPTIVRKFCSHKQNPPPSRNFHIKIIAKIKKNRLCSLFVNIFMI